MSETETVEVFTVRGYRHDARHAMNTASQLLSGREGLTVEEQVDRVNQAKRALIAATNAANLALELIQSRDNAAWQASKHRADVDAETEESDNDDDDDDDDTA